MSYCRWSTDDFRCDLYVYEASDGIYVHIAGSKHNLPTDAFPEKVDFWSVDDYFDMPEEERAALVERYVARTNKVMEIIHDAPRVPIGGPYDGHTLSFSDHEEAAWWIENKLGPLGIYNYPDDLVAALRADMETDDAN